MLDGGRQYSITSIVEKLIGNIQAIGDSQRDREALENLEEVDVLINGLIETLYNNVNVGEHSYEGSVQDVGMKSKDILSGLRDWI